MKGKYLVGGLQIPGTWENHDSVLLNSCPSHTSTFDAWLVEWKSNTDLDIRLGLLHGLNNRECYWNASRLSIESLLVFLITVADGYLCSHGSDHEGDRRKISYAAARVLSARFFKAYKDLSDPDHFFHVLNSLELYRSLLWFFRVDDQGRVINFPHADHVKSEDLEIQRMRAFLKGFAKLGWERSLGTDYVNNMVRNDQPQFLKLLLWLGEFDYLLQRNLTPSSRRALKKLVYEGGYTNVDQVIHELPQRTAARLYILYTSRRKGYRNYKKRLRTVETNLKKK